MRIGWKQIEPQVARKVGERFAAQEAAATASRTFPAAVLPETKAATPALEAAWSVVSALFAVAVLCLYVSICFHLGGPLMTLMLSLLPVLMLLGVMVPGVVVGNQNGHRRASSEVGTGAALLRRGRNIGAWIRPDDSGHRAALAEAAQTRAERLYGEILLMLADSDTPLHPRTGRDILRQCNALVADSYRVETQRRKVRTLLTEDADAEIGRGAAEHADLQNRLRAADDPLTRRSLNESVALCAERLENLRALAPMIGRLDAQQEMICQALLLARTALAREQVTPVALHLPDVAGLRETVRQVTSQTRAVEEAVAEVIRF